MSGFNLGKCNLPSLQMHHQRRQLRLVITDSQRSRKKPVTVDLANPDDGLSALLAGAKAKLNMRKKPSRVTTAQGEVVVDSAVLMTLPDESLVVIV